MPKTPITPSPTGLKLAVIDPAKIQLAPTQEEKALAELIASMEQEATPEATPPVDPNAVPYGLELLWGPFPARWVKRPASQDDPFDQGEVLDVTVRLLADDREHHLEVHDGTSWDRYGHLRCPTDAGVVLARCYIKVSPEHLALLSGLPQYRRGGKRPFDAMPKGATTTPHKVEKREGDVGGWGALMKR